MGRPLFYDTGNPVESAARLGMDLYKMKKDASLRQGALDVDRQRAAMEQRRTDVEYGTPAAPGQTTPLRPGLAERRVDIDQSAQDLAAQQQAFAEKKYEESRIFTDRKMDSTDFAKIRIGMKNASKQYGIGLDKVTEPLMNEYEHLSSKGATRYDLFQASIGGLYDKHKPGILEEIDRGLEKATAANDRSKVEQLTQLRRAVDKGGPVLQSLFPNSVQRFKTEREQLEVKRKIPPTPPETFNAPYETDAGDVYQESNRGKVRLVKGAKTPPAEQPGVKERRDIATSKDVAKAEETILSNPENPAIAGHIEMFNRSSTAPYIFIQKEVPGKLYGTNIETAKIQLPKINGKQATAKDITFTAEENGLTVEEVLMKLGVMENPNAKGPTQ